MNRFYIEAKLHTDLKTELLKVFTSIVADQHVSRLIPLMVTAQAKPFCIPPAVMSTMCKHLYQLNPDYTVIEPKLFSSYLPNVLPQMTEEDLQVHLFPKLVRFLREIVNDIFRYKKMLTGYYKNLCDPRVGVVMKTCLTREKEILRKSQGLLIEGRT